MVEVVTSSVEDPATWGALGVASAIRAGDVSCREVVEALLDRIARYNPSLNAIVTLDEVGARARADLADVALARGEVWGPLHGVPVTFKDVFETAGLRTTSSHRPLAGYVPERDATVVARLRAAGAIVLGKTNMPDLAGDNQSDSPVFGRANNPWDLGRTPGGSSGGEAAAVAAGLTLLGSGSDIGGSLRLPAHFCGVFALKPTDHLVSNAGHIPPLPGSVNTVRHLAVNGPIARHPEDLGLWVSLVAGPDGRDGTVPPVPVAGPELVPRTLAGLRIAWTDDVGGIPVTADTRDALTRFATELADAGCQVVRAAPPGVDIEEVWQTYATLYGAMIFAMQPRVARVSLRTVGPAMFRDPIFGPSSRAATASAREFLHALARRDTLMWAMEEFLADVDAWVCPVASIPAFPHRPARQTGRPVQVDDQKVPGTVATIGHTMLASLTGHPAVAQPLTHHNGDLPIGVQVIGRLWQDHELLNVVSTLTTLSGPCPRPPGSP